MKIDPDDLRVDPGARVRMKDWPTLVKPFYDSEKGYKDALQEGREQMAEACRRYLALGSVQLPSYGDGATTVDLPPWAYRDGYGEYFEIGESA